MTSIQVTNFKTDLYLNYYDKTEEPSIFFEWLQENTTYDNGVWRFHTSKINHETEQKDTGKGWDTLKKFVSSWARSRYNKQEAWNTWLNERLEYTNGRFYLDNVNNDYVKQTIKGSYSRETTLGNDYVYYLKVDCTPSLTGQKVIFDEDYTIYRRVTDKDGVLRLYFLSDKILTDPLHVHVEAERNSNGKVYSGAVSTVSVI